jgi:hypothetical protein
LAGQLAFAKRMRDSSFELRIEVQPSFGVESTGIPARWHEFRSMIPRGKFQDVDRLHFWGATFQWAYLNLPQTTLPLQALDNSGVPSIHQSKCGAPAKRNGGAAKGTNRGYRELSKRLAINV